MTTRLDIRVHLFPILACNSIIILFSLGEKDSFFKSSLKWLAHLSLQLFPQRANPVIFRTAFQFPSPRLLTYSTNTESSVAVHGPFFNTILPSLPMPTPQLFIPLLPKDPPHSFCAVNCYFFLSSSSFFVECYVLIFIPKKKKRFNEGFL
ncbi:hypothetical protein V6Z12_D11G321800 [Gossypium hirsutum]